MDFAVIILLLGITGLIAWQNFKPKNNQETQPLLAERDTLKEEITTLRNRNQELEPLKSLNDKQSGTLSAQEKQITTLEAENRQQLERLKNAGRQLSGLEARQEQREKEKQESITEAQKTREAFEAEKKRLIEKEEAKRIKETEERNRIWNEHENQVIATLKGICRQPEIDFDHYDNNNLPQNFDGKFKPDFLVEFLGQYIVLDAKVNDINSNNPLQNYLRENAKSTAKKIKEATNTEEIYKTVFFVVPSIAIRTMKSLSFVEQDIKFYVVSEESLEPILSMFKKVTYYENIEQIDPRERENIIEVIANFEYEINYQNAVNVLSIARGIKASQAKSALPKEMLNSIEQVNQKKRLETLKPTDLKRLINDPEEQINEVRKLIIKKEPLIRDEDITTAQDTLL
jgi:hypothetical protein